MISVLWGEGRFLLFLDLIRISTFFRLFSSNSNCFSVMTFTLCSTFTFTFCRGKEDKDNVVLYFDSWPREELCIALPLKQVDIIQR